MARQQSIPLAVLTRLHLAYFWRHRRLLRFKEPLRFTEFVQLRKAADRDPRFPRFADKVAVKAHIQRELGRQWVIPTLWEGPVPPLQPPCPRPFVIKARHAANRRAFFLTGEEDWAKICRDASGWTTRPYGRWLDEWLYSEIPRGLLVEPFVGRDGKVPTDYKVYVFHGRAECVQVHLDRAHDHRWILFDRGWKQISRFDIVDPPAPPSALTEILLAAETLGADFDFVRIDFYQPDRQPLFGEMTFYPGSGLDPFDPLSLDEWLGALWLQTDTTSLHHHPRRFDDDC